MASKKTTKKAGKPSEGSRALDFCREYLRKNPQAPFAEIRDAAKKRGTTLYPITYGRAKALEGLITVSAYGSKKAGAKRGPGRPKGSKNKRGPGRPRKAAVSGLESIDGLVSTLKSLQRERDQAVAAVDKIRNLLDSLER